MSQQLYSNVGFNQVLEVRKGGTFDIQLEVTDEEGNTFDITGYEAKATIALKSDPTQKVDFVFGDGGGDGRIRGQLSATDANTLLANDAKMSAARYRWNADLKAPNGDIIPFCYGDVFVKNADTNWDA